MMKLSTKSKSSHDISEVTNEICISAKLRRLKIQESVLMQNISTHMLNCDENSPNKASFDTLLDFKTFFMKNKHALSEVTKLFQDIKTSISSQVTLKNIDIDDIKNNVFDLENRIKTLKYSVQSELTSLKLTEKQLNNEINELPREIHAAKKICKKSKQKYSDIVPSPIKLLLESPFKCLEVQEYQDFMKKNRNRYGGWNEYNHNIFQNYWQSHVGCSHEINYENVEREFPDLEHFIEDLFPKLHGISRQEIKLHVEWYAKYIFLKNRQQQAVQKWRSNREILKKSRKVSRQTEIEESKMTPRKNRTNNRFNEIKGTTAICSVDYDKSRTVDESSVKINICVNTSMKNNDTHFLKPTKQWMYKITDVDLNTKYYNNMNLDHIPKLGTPNWRAELL